MNKETGGSAFPVDRQCAHAQAMESVGAGDETRYIKEVNKISGGMTLRDYFAAKAIQAWLSQIPPDEMEDMIHRWAENSYEMADAMLKARVE